MNKFAMWTLLVLCGVIASHGVQGADRFQTTGEMDQTTGEMNPTTGEMVQTTGVPGARCGSHFFSRRGAFTSPNYPAAYPLYADCTWYITPNNGTVKLDFSDVGIEYEQNCAFDAVYVFDGPSTSSRLLGKLCGKNSTTFRSTGSALTVRFTSDGSASSKGFRADFWALGGSTCRNRCGYHLGDCSCGSRCDSQGNCCPDYKYYCPTTTQRPHVTPRPSCYNKCGWDMGSCSCSSSCRYYGNCCYDYHSTCLPTTLPVRLTTNHYSCQYRCGNFLGSCSCTSSCRYQGNCCYDYNAYCRSTVAPTIGPRPSCYNKCGWNMGSCSCSSSCRYNGNCCYDYHSYCQAITNIPATAKPCGGHLFGSGTFSSPNHPNHYHDNAYCVWQLRAAYDQRIFLAFTYLQLENCCSCDYIGVYDGPSVGSRYLGKVCNNSSLSTFYSTSNYLTVLFRTDSSVVGRGFSADFTSSLPPSSGRVDCSSDNMNIVIQRTYLGSLGYDGQNLYLNDPHCRPQVSRYQVVFSFPINTCGNVRKFENGRVEYTNAIRAYTSSSGEITRQSHLKLNLGCRMEQDSVAQIMYVVRHHENSSITGTGRFNTSMDFYTLNNFYYKVTQIPYEVTLNQNLYVQVNLRSGDSSLVLFLDTCVTSPTPHDFNYRPYYLVRNGCPVDSTYRVYTSGTRPFARFTFKAFQFLRATESVYIQCKVLVCQASDYNSRCRRGCNRRAARDLGSEHDSKTLVLGPIQLKEPEKKEEENPKQDKA